MPAAASTVRRSIQFSKLSLNPVSFSIVCCVRTDDAVATPQYDYLTESGCAASEFVGEAFVIESGFRNKRDISSNSSCACEIESKRSTFQSPSLLPTHSSSLPLLVYPSTQSMSPPSNSGSSSSGGRKAKLPRSCATCPFPPYAIFSRFALPANDTQGRRGRMKRTSSASTRYRLRLSLFKTATSPRAQSPAFLFKLVVENDNLTTRISTTTSARAVTPPATVLLNDDARLPLPRFLRSITNNNRSRTFQKEWDAVETLDVRTIATITTPPSINTISTRTVSNNFFSG